MNSSSVAFFLSLLCLSSANAARLNQRQEDECPQIETISELDVTAYLGTWYQPEGLAWFWGPEGSRCVTANYELDDAGLVNVRNTIIGPNNSYLESCGKACVPDNERPGELFVQFPAQLVGDDFCQFEDPAAVNTNYKILGVVEDSWASVYDCQETGGEVREFAWLLTRDPVPSQDVLDAARAVYTANGIDVSRFIPYPQDESAQCQDAGPPDGITCFGEELPPLPM